jgi:hypothetical protein
VLELRCQGSVIHMPRAKRARAQNPIVLYGINTVVHRTCCTKNLSISHPALRACSKYTVYLNNPSPPTLILLCVRGQKNRFGTTN